jgi:malate dehydrogenase (oxaloacetate-decarboxylating)(NADP+)
MVAKARDIVKQREPNLVCDGDIQPLVAFNKEILKENYPFSELVNGEPNVLIFPNLASSNIAYNLLQEVGDADAIGPILLGLKKSVHILQLGSSVRSIFNMVLISVIDAQMKGRTDVDAAIKKSPWWKRFRKVSHDM